jgi:hypothetical protein
MWNARTRIMLVSLAFLLVFGAAGMVVGVPAIDRIAGGDTLGGWILVGLWIATVAALFVGVTRLLRRPAFRAEPLDWTLPAAERRRLVREEEERYRRSRADRK